MFKKLLFTTVAMTSLLIYTGKAGIYPEPRGLYNAYQTLAQDSDQFGSPPTTYLHAITFEQTRDGRSYVTLSQVKCNNHLVTETPNADGARHSDSSSGTLAKGIRVLVFRWSDSRRTANWAWNANVTR